MIFWSPGAHNLLKIFFALILILYMGTGRLKASRGLGYYYNMTVWILAGKYINFAIAAGLIRLHMPGVKKSRV